MTPASLLRLLLVLLLAVPLAAQTTSSESKPASSNRKPPEMITDRPDQTEATSIVPPGYFQIEAGWLFTRDDEEGLRRETHELPGTLVRIGVIDGLELRAAWSGYLWEDVGFGALEAEENGAGDAELGTKFRLRRQKGVLPETAFLVGVSLPVGEGNFSSDRVDPSFRFIMAHTLSERVGLGYNLGVVWETKLEENGNRATLSRYLYTLSLGVSLLERLGAFIEVFGEVAASAAGPPAHSLDGGLTYLLRPNLQLDLAGGVGLSNAADDWFVGAGFSVRFPE